MKGNAMEVYIPCWRFNDLEWHWDWINVRHAATGIALAKEWGYTGLACRRRSPMWTVHPGWLASA